MQLSRNTCDEVTVVIDLREGSSAMTLAYSGNLLPMVRLFIQNCCLSMFAMCLYSLLLPCVYATWTSLFGFEILSGLLTIAAAVNTSRTPGSQVTRRVNWYLCLFSCRA